MLDQYKEDYFKESQDENEEWRKKYDHTNFNNLAKSQMGEFIDNVRLYNKINHGIANDDNDEYPDDEIPQIKKFLDKINKDVIDNKKMHERSLKSSKMKLKIKIQSLMSLKKN